jgi:hypothetical protein
VRSLSFFFKFLREEDIEKIDAYSQKWTYLYYNYLHGY